MWWFKYFVEFWGVVVILYTKMLTHADPPVLGLVYFMCLTMARGITTAYFSPMSGAVSYMMGHMPLEDLAYNLIAHALGTLAVAVSYMPIRGMLEN